MVPQVVGTQGYAAPEYVDSGHLTAKSDVFSFGVVLLELVSGRKVMDVSACPSSIVAWAAPLIAAGRAREVLDTRVAAPPTAPPAAALLRCSASACPSRRID